jgi:hypothetical protein
MADNPGPWLSEFIGDTLANQIVHEMYVNVPNQTRRVSMVLGPLEVDLAAAAGRERCDERAYTRMITCCLEPGHGDLPHIGQADSVEQRYGRLLITAVRSAPRMAL